MTWRMEITAFVRVMRVKAGSPRQKTNGQTAEDLAELHKGEISGEAPVAMMVERLWSWSVIMRSCSILSLNQSSFQVRARMTGSTKKMSGTLFTRPSYSFKMSGKASSGESTVIPALCLVRSLQYHPSVSKAWLISPSIKPRTKVRKPPFCGDRRRCLA